MRNNRLTRFAVRIAFGLLVMGIEKFAVPVEFPEDDDLLDDLLDEEDDEEDDDETAELDAAYLTTGLLTAGQALHAAHRDGRDCSPHHTGLVVLLKQIDSQLISVLIIENLVKIAAQRMDEDEVEKMVDAIVHAELESGDNDPFDN